MQSNQDDLWGNQKIHFDVKIIKTPAARATAVNLCESLEMIINYTYKDMGHQLMILDIGAPVSIAGES